MYKPDDVDPIENPDSPSKKRRLDISANQQNQQPYVPPNMDPNEEQKIDVVVASPDEFPNAEELKMFEMPSDDSMTLC